MGRLSAEDGGRDVIVAPATAPGRAALAVIRLSGPEGRTREVLGRLAPGLRAPERTPRQARVCRLVDPDGRPVDRALALFFPAPASATGEEVVELSCHGSPAVVEAILRAARAAGARPARPGEFTRRALANGKLDLAEAEGVARLTAAESRSAARRALGLVEGQLSRRVLEVREALLALLTEMEAGFDFAEDVSFVPAGAVESTLAAVETRLAELLRATATTRGDRVPEVVLTGAPNVGKSTLFNALLGRDRAIVTAVPGTTRDALSEEMELAGESIRLLDTAGLRESADVVERIGVEVARRAARGADLVVHLVDLSGGVADVSDGARSITGGDSGGPERDGRALIVGTKADLGRRRDGVDVAVSALTGEGLDALREEIRRRLVLEEVEGALPALERHREALERARRELGEARQALGLGEELAASALRRAVSALGEITGEVASEELLDRIFSGFCIGK